MINKIVHALREALEATNRYLKDVTVLSDQNDPFRMDTPANHRDGKWLADTLERLGIIKLHNRGIHYAFLGHPKPDGKPYTSEDWKWLAGPIDAARWLGYIDWENITDERNLPPVIRIWEEWHPEGSINQGVSLPEIQTEVDLAPVLTEEMYGKQPYHLAIFGEKSSLEPSLRDISNRFTTDLYLPTGEISDTMLYQMAKSGADDPRPMVVFCISDCDPSGWQMPISISRKLQAFKVTRFPDLDFRVYRVAITPWQVKNSLQHLQLPSSPLKEKEARADKWEQRMGVEQIEVDALVTLHPEVLRELVIKAITPFYDETLDERVQEAEDQWLAKAQAIIDQHTNQKALAKANQQLAKLSTHVESQIAKINSIKILDQEVEEIELPEIEMPEAEDNSAQAKDPLIDSNWSFTNQCRRLIKSKQYRKLPKPEYDVDD